MVSTLILITVTPTQSSLFDQAWKNMKLSPGSFNLLGGNCSTHASIAFVEAKIVSGGIPGLDTPDNLYHQLKSKMAGKYKIYSGYLGFRPTLSKRFDIEVEKATP